MFRFREQKIVHLYRYYTFNYTFSAAINLEPQLFEGFSETRPSAKPQYHVLDASVYVILNDMM